MQFTSFIQQFAERFGIEVPEVVDDAVAFDADGMPCSFAKKDYPIGGDFDIMAAKKFEEHAGENKNRCESNNLI